MKIIIGKNEPHDMITDAAAMSYIRLERKDLTDAQAVIELLKTGNLSVLNGAIIILAFDDMKPPEDDIKTIISILDSKPEKKIAIREFMDPREYLLSAMHKWKDATSHAYMKRFAESENKDLKECAELALKGKRARYE